MGNIKEQYYRLPEEEIQELILSAQTGNQSAQRKLLHEFRNFLSKYVALLFYSKYDYRNYDMRRFIALYISDRNIRRKFLRAQASHIDLKAVNKIVHDINFMVTRYCDEDDVRQTIEMTFLQCLSKYKRRESKSVPGEYVPFSGFIYTYFFYMLKKNVDAFLISELARQTFPLITESDFDDSEDPPPGFVSPPEPSAEELLGPDEIDEFWVIGDTAMYPFDRLSHQDRQLLKWRYVDGMRTSEIAQRTTEHANTIRERFTRIRNALQEIASEDLT